jgi:hypothetical protein
VKTQNQVLQGVPPRGCALGGSRAPARLARASSASDQPISRVLLRLRAGYTCCHLQSSLRWPRKTMTISASLRQAIFLQWSMTS